MTNSISHSAMTAQSLPWMEPLELAQRINDDYWVLLYSGAQADYSGRYSYLAWDMAERVEGKDFSAFERVLLNNGERFNPAWFGYLGYGLKDTLEDLTPEQPNQLAVPDLCMMRFHCLCEFDHAQKTLTLWSDKKDATVPPAASCRELYPARVSDITSNMTRQAYLEKAEQIISRIRAGDLYQANLTRKFMGEFTAEANAFDLFKKLCKISPAPYSVFMRIGDTSILSSSPELFLSLHADGRVTTCPIKGTAPRHQDATQDKAARDALVLSAKDRAENLMIVDLMRHDLSRACVPGSVKAETLFEVTSHPTIHHLSSTVVGQKKPDMNALDLVKACFPPGSMTGAPKISAMNLCAELEQQARGIYSGAIGWFGGDGSCDLSVIIRTLIIQKRYFEFQVGGGIVADSTPEKEWLETMHKARGLLAALALADDALIHL